MNDCFYALQDNQLSFNLINYFLTQLKSV